MLPSGSIQIKILFLIHFKNLFLFQAIGNHEFDDGPSGLAPYLKALKAPVLAANMDVSMEPSLQGLFQPYIVIERNKRKIGIIGLITPETKVRIYPVTSS